MKILALDVSTNLGMAFYEGGDPASIQCWGGRIERDTYADDICEQIGPKLIELGPDIVVAEAPLAGLVFPKKGRDLYGATGGQGISTAGLLLNRLSGAVHMLVRVQCLPYEEVQPRTWQAAMLAGIAGSDTKARAAKACEYLKIKEASNEHKRDAALIAMWAWTHSQQKKRIEYERHRLSPIC